MPNEDSVPDAGGEDSNGNSAGRWWRRLIEAALALAALASGIAALVTALNGNGPT